MSAKKKRSYHSPVRAAAVEETRRRLTDAALALGSERPYEEVTLEAIAERAEVTLQTLLRHFGSKSGLFAAAAAAGTRRVEAQRGAAIPGDIAGAVSNLFDHYDEWADLSLRMLSQEELSEEIAENTRSGRALHKAWVERVFAPQIELRQGHDRDILVAQLVVVCDVYVWKLLHRDLALSRADAQEALIGMIEALCSP